MKSDWSARAARVCASSRNHLTATLASMTARSIARIPHPSDECCAVPTRTGLSSKSIHTPCGLESIPSRSEEHTSELQSHSDLVCRLLLEKKNKNTKQVN